MNNIISQLKNISCADAIDIVIVTLLFYFLLKFIRDRRAGKLTVGIALVVAVMVLSKAFNFYTLGFLIENVVQVGIIGIIILFQSELRAFLEKVGGSPIKSLGQKLDHKSGTTECIEAVVSAVKDFSAEKTGALIVFERGTKLGDVIKTGTVINADTVAYLAKNIFFNKAPLHDGALIIRDNRFYSAGCLLPLSQNPEIVKDLGTRHRAAIGMSENSDAVVVVVSEETGDVSIALDGHLTRGLNENALKSMLNNLLSCSQEGRRSFIRNSKKAVNS